MTLAFVISTATRQKLCTSWGCTTCGTQQFKDLVADYLGVEQPLAESGIRRLAEELSVLETISNHDAVEFLIRWVDSNLGQRELASILGNSPAGLLYGRMLSEKAKRGQARREHDMRNNTRFVETNRAAKKEAKAAAHAERLRLKASRDAERQEK